MGGIDVGSVLSGLGSGLSSLAGGGGGGGGGGGSASNTSGNITPNAAAQNILTNPDILAQFAMDQGEGPPQQAPPIPPTPTFASTNFFSPQQTMPYSGQPPPQSPQPLQNPWRSTPQPASTPDVQYDPSTGWPLPPSTPPQPAAPGANTPQIADQPTQITNPVPEFGYESTQYPGDQTGPSPFEAGGRTSAVGTSPVGGGTGDGATPPAAGGKGTSISDIAKKGVDIANKAKGLAGPQQRGYYPDVAGSAREAGMAAPSAYTPQGGGPGFNPLQSIADALFGHPMGSGLAGAARQAGPSYGATSLPSPQPTAGAGPAAAGAPTAQAGAMPPGSAAEAVQAGARGAGLGRSTAAGGEKPPLVLRDPSDPSKGYMPDPNYRAPGSSGEAKSAVGASRSGQHNPTGVPGDILAGARDAASRGGPAAVARWMAQNGHPRDGNWCAEFASAVMHEARQPLPPGNANVASNWRNWGVRSDAPQAGGVIVRKGNYWNGAGVRTGDTGSHVAIVESVDGQGNIHTIGGNQGAMRGLIPRSEWGRWDFRVAPQGGSTPDVSQLHAQAGTDRRGEQWQSRGDRNNNPGNIKMGPDAQAAGATGVDNQGHAIFPNWEAGEQAQKNLLRNRYNNMTIPQIFDHGRGYAQDPGWPRGVMQFGGFSPHERLDLNDPKTLDRLQRAIWRQEGTHPPADQAQVQLPTQLAGNLGWGDIIGMIPVGGLPGAVTKNTIKSTSIGRATDPNRPLDMSSLGLPGIATWRDTLGLPGYGTQRDGYYVP